jgi:hypothetical protein
VVRRRPARLVGERAGKVAGSCARSRRTSEVDQSPRSSASQRRQLALDLSELPTPIRTAALTSAHSPDHPLLYHPSLHIARTVRDALADLAGRRTVAHPSPAVDRRHRDLEPLGQFRCRKWCALAQGRARLFDFRRVLRGRAVRVGAGPHRGTVPISWIEPYGSLDPCVRQL